MKRIILLLTLALVVVGCTKSKVANYSFRNDSGDSITDVLLCEYNSSGDRIKINNVATMKDGDVVTFTADASATKVKVQFTVDVGFFNFKTYWISQVFMLDGGTTDIVLDKSTIIGNKEP